MMKIQPFLILPLAALMVSACGGDDSDGSRDDAGASTSIAAASGNNPLFDRIDAGTFMIGANLAPAPEEVIEHIWQSTEMMAELNESSYEEASDSVEDASPALAALFDELATIDDRESLEALGVHSNGYWAVHMISVYPVAHLELADQAAFEAMLERVEARSDTPLPRRQVGGEEVLWIADGGLGVALHHDAQFLTVALIPDDAVLLRRIANLDQPTQAFEAEQLASFNQDQGFVPHGSGFVDLQGLIGQLMDRDDALSATARERMGFDALAEDPACQSEMSAVTRIFPRITAGLSALNLEALDMKMVLETEQEMAARLTPIADTPVGLTQGATRTVSGGLAFDPVAARDFGRELVSAWIASPPECAAFAPIAAGASDWQRALNQPIPPVVTNIRGFRVNIDEVMMAENGQVEDAAGTVALFVRNPEMLLGMAQMFSPELAGMGIEPNGEPKPVPDGLIPNISDIAAFLALSDEAIGLSVGDGQQERLPEALTAYEPDGAIFAYTIDFDGYSKLSESMMSRFGAMEGMPTDELPSVDVMAQFAEMYDTSSLAIKLTDNGIEIESKLSMTP